MKKTLVYTLSTVVLLLLAAFWIWEIWQALSTHWHVFYGWCTHSGRNIYHWLLWCGIGTIIFPLLHRYHWKNEEIVRTHTHERAHMLVGMLFFMKIHSIQASAAEGGQVRYSGSHRLTADYMMGLAPYCFPFWTILCLLLRCLCVASLLPVMDIIIGFTIGLHLTCWATQTGTHQSDITDQPAWFSYLYIGSIQLFNLALLLMSFLPGKNIFLAFREFGIDIWQFITLAWGYIF